MARIFRFLPVLVVLISFLAITACKQPGPAERAGQDVDRVMEDTGEAIEDFGEDIRDRAGGRQ